MSKDDAIAKERERLSNLFLTAMKSENKKQAIKAQREYNKWVYAGKPVEVKKRKKTKENTENETTS